MPEAVGAIVARGAFPSGIRPCEQHDGEGFHLSAPGGARDENPRPLKRDDPAFQWHGATCSGGGGNVTARGVLLFTACPRNLRKWGFAGFACAFVGCSLILNELEAFAWPPGFGALHDNLHHAGVFVSKSDHFLAREAMPVPQGAQ